jgi:hypothetical protein
MNFHCGREQNHQHALQHKLHDIDFNNPHQPQEAHDIDFNNPHQNHWVRREQQHRDQQTQRRGKKIKLRENTTSELHLNFTG